MDTKACIFTEKLHTGGHTSTLWAWSHDYICFCGWTHSNPDSASFVMGFPCFVMAARTVYPKHMWPQGEADVRTPGSIISLADRRRSRQWRPRQTPALRLLSQSCFPPGFSCPSCLFALHITFLTLVHNFNPPCTCFSCLSTGQWIWKWLHLPILRCTACWIFMFSLANFNAGGFVLHWPLLCLLPSVQASRNSSPLTPSILLLFAHFHRQPRVCARPFLPLISPNFT